MHPAIVLLDQWYAPSRCIDGSPALTACTCAEEDGESECKHPSMRDVWLGLAAHLRRVAGTHVRNSATVVGNLVLARLRGLPSDVATLMLAAGGSSGHNRHTPGTARCHP